MTKTSKTKPKAKQRLTQLKIQGEQEALEWRKRPDVISLGSKSIPIITIRESEYKELLDFSTSTLIYVSGRIKACLDKSDYKQLGIVCFDPEEQSPFAMQEGIVVDICEEGNIPSIFLKVQPREMMLFNLYKKQKDLLIAKIFKYKENPTFKEAESVLLEKCTNLALTYLSKIDKERYFTLLNKLIYIEKSKWENKFKTKFLLLLSILEAKEVNGIFHGGLNHQQLLLLKKSLARQLETSAAKAIRCLAKAPKDYLPCIVISDYDFNQNVSLNEGDFTPQMEDFKDIAEGAYNTYTQKQVDIILLNSCNADLEGIGIQAKASPSLNAKLKLSARVKISDLILVNRIIYAKTEPADKKLTKQQLVQASAKYRGLIPIYNGDIEYPHCQMMEYTLKENAIKQEQFLHNNSYEMMQSLKLPFFPIIPLSERFELIKKKIKNKLLQKIEGLNEEYQELAKEGGWERALEKATALVSYDPENSDYYEYKAHCLKQLERYKEAIENYELGLTWYEKKGKAKASLADFYFAKGVCWFYLENYQEASGAFDKVNTKDLCASNAETFEEYRKKISSKIENNDIESFSLENIGLSIEKLPLPDNIRSYAKKLHASYEKAESERYKNEYLHYLVSLLTLPWGKKNKLETNLKAVQQNLEKSHFGLNEVKNRILESLVFSLRGGSTKPPILCLVGPPGVGKTSIANALAKALGRKCTRLPLGGMHDTSVIKGFVRTWGGAESGKVLSLIRQVGSWNPVMVLDEIDKIGHGVHKSGVEGALLALLDPEQNAQFSDDYFDATFDLSEVFFIATANSVDDISFPLLNRMEVIHLSSYTDKEKLEIAKRYLIPKILEEAKASSKEIKITATVIKEIIANYTKEAGVRELERLLRSLVQKYLLKQAIAEDQSKDLNIDKKLLEGSFRNKRISKEIYSRIPSVGRATGLAYNPMGGNTINIEAMAVSGSGKIKATGKLGDVLKESIEVAYARAIADLEELRIPISDISKKDIHVHLLEGAIPKEGPSAGITIYASLVSLLSGKKAKLDVAMTGEIGLYGDVFAIGGLKEKLAAAARESIKIVVIPKANQKDLIDIPEELKNCLEIKTVLKTSELLNIIFDMN